MDLVRRGEQEVASTLKKSRYLWLTNPRRLSAGQRRRLATCAASAARLRKRTA